MNDADRFVITLPAAEIHTPQTELADFHACAPKIDVFQGSLSFVSSQEIIRLWLDKSQLFVRNVCVMPSVILY
jgi:hypothetical protein